MFFQVECLSLVIACLCHDLDHRGTNNSFQTKSSSNLAQLYSTSTMEHHHFDQCLMILNSKGNQILSNVSQDEFKRVISTVQDAILATDLAVYFKRRKDTFALLESGEMDFQNDNHRLDFKKITRCQNKFWMKMSNSQYWNYDFFFVKIICQIEVRSAIYCRNTQPLNFGAKNSNLDM